MYDNQAIHGLWGVSFEYNRSSVILPLSNSLGVFQRLPRAYCYRRAMQATMENHCSQAVFEPTCFRDFSLTGVLGPYFCSRNKSSTHDSRVEGLVFWCFGSAQLIENQVQNQPNSIHLSSYLSAFESRHTHTHTDMLSFKTSILSLWFHTQRQAGSTSHTMIGYGILCSFFCLRRGKEVFCSLALSWARLGREREREKHSSIHPTLRVTHIMGRKGECSYARLYFYFF